jgi:hypothetical protein
MFINALLVAFIFLTLVCTVAIITATIIAARAESNFYRVKQLDHRGIPTVRRFYWPTMATLAIVPCLLLVASLLLRIAAPSLPGDWLYPVKRSAEEVNGLLVRYFGDPVDWHMSQVDLRAQELTALETAGRDLEPASVQEIHSEFGKALAAAVALAPTELASLF